MGNIPDIMAEWSSYCKVFNGGASRPQLLDAAKGMKDPENRRVALRNLGVLTAAEKAEIAARWASIDAVTDAEIARHCQFEGLPKI